MNDEVIITCAVTGSGDTVGVHPAIPVTPEEIANAAIEAARAGAAIAHIHVRDVETGRGNRDRALFREAVERVRDSNTDVVINLTTGMGGDYIPSEADPAVAAPGADYARPEERVLHVEELRPEICSLDCGSMNFGPALMLNTEDHLRVMAEHIKNCGVKPEIEAFDLSHIHQAVKMSREGAIPGKLYVQFVMGVKNAMPVDKETFDFYVQTVKRLAPDAEWCGAGIGPGQIMLNEWAIAAGGHTRTGLEDNLRIDRNTMAPSNAALVKRAADLCEKYERPVATWQQAREILELRPA